MSPQESVEKELMAMIELVIHERGIPLPGKRLYWYARWFGIDTGITNVYRVLNLMVRQGRLVKHKEGIWVFYDLAE